MMQTKTTAQFCRRIKEKEVVVDKLVNRARLYVKGEIPVRQYSIERSNGAADRHLIARCLHTELRDAEIFTCTFQRRAKRLFLDTSGQTHDCNEHLRESLLTTLTPHEYNHTP